MDRESPIYILRNDEWWWPRYPSYYKGGVYTIVSEARNVDGKFRGDEIRNEVSKVTVRFNIIFANEWSELLKCFSERFGGKFVGTFKFLDEVSNEFIERELYVSDREAEYYSMLTFGHQDRILTNVEIRFVEV